MKRRILVVMNDVHLTSEFIRTLLFGSVSNDQSACTQFSSDIVFQINT